MPAKRLPAAASAPRSLPRLEADAKPTPTLINLAELRRDGGTQMRPKLKPFQVEQIIEAIREGKPIDAAQVIYDGSNYWLWDGFHRAKAYEEASLKALPCIVTPGTQRDAVRLSLTANSDHDKEPRDRETLQNVVRTALLDPEWGQLSNREIARLTKVSEGMIRSWRSQLQSEPEPDAETETEAPAPRVRVGKDGRAINTANIGSAQKQAAASAPKAAAASVAPTVPVTPVTTRSLVVPPPIPATPKQAILIQAGDSWNLGDHRVYCGESNDYAFQDALLPSSLAFVTLPPGSYDTEAGFLVQSDYDWLARFANTIAVLIQEASAVQPFLAATQLNYGYATGCTLYGDWGFLAFFSQGEWTADELDDTDERSSPNQLFTALLTTYTNPQDAVIVIDGPQQGAFSPLVLSEQLKRRCLLASAYKATLQQQINNYKNTFVPDLV